VGQERLADGRATSGKVLSEIPAKGTRRSKSLEVLISILYLKCMSMGDFEEALAALLRKDAGSLSASTIARLKDACGIRPKLGCP
jgi:hypothetical protein